MFSELEQLKSDRDIEGLFAFLQSNKDNSDKGWMARLDAAEALAQLGDKRGLDYLHRMAESPNKDIQEIASEIINGLKDHQPKSVLAEQIAQAKETRLPSSDHWFYKINSKYPYVVAWAGFITLYIIVSMVVSPLVTLFSVATQPWLPAWISSLVLVLLLMISGFFVFRFVVKIFVLPYEKQA